MLRSPLVEDEPDRRAGRGWKPCGPLRGLGFECSVLCPWRANRTGAPAPPRKRMAVVTRWGSRPPFSALWMVNLPGGRRPFEAGRAPLGVLGVGSSAICSRAPTQPVKRTA